MFEQAVRINGAVQLVAGSMLALGRFPRVSALAVAASLLPTTYAGHRFWETDDKQERTQQRIHFLKNVSMFGGLLIAAGDTAGNPSIAWRGRHALTSAKRDAALATKSAKAGSQGRQPRAGPRRPRYRARPAPRPAGWPDACPSADPSLRSSLRRRFSAACTESRRRSWEGAERRAPSGGRRAEGAERRAPSGGRRADDRYPGIRRRIPTTHCARSVLSGGYWVTWGASALLRPRLRASAVYMSS